MKILMLTNTFTPHVGGVARSVQAFAAQYRQRGHEVLIVAPVFDNMPDEEPGVIRVPAIQNFNGSDFSVRLPLSATVAHEVREFAPDIVHAHHPFLLGENAVKLAASQNVPLVFTHHTMYEQYTHYVPGDSPALQRFIINLTTSFANLCDRVFAPSESVARVIADRGVLTPIDIVPTGVDVEHFRQGSGVELRAQLKIPPEAFVVGHLGRLAPEKNLEFLADAVALMMQKHRQAHFIVAGSGPSTEHIERIFTRRRMRDRLHLVGSKSGQALVDTYHAMDVFAFASQSETQGMVLTEAMAAGLPVVAVDASGAREVVQDGVNGALLAAPHVKQFAAALGRIAQADSTRREQLRTAARATAAEFSMDRCAEKALAAYQELIDSEVVKQADQTGFDSALRVISAEWQLWSNVAYAAGHMLQGKHLWKMPLLGPLVRRWRRLRRWISRNEWGIRLLKLPVSDGTAAEPGLILIQVDGFSRAQLEHAIKHRRMPFLRRLMAREGYRLHTMYSGLPSTTPAVQGELFYGVKRAVPSFGFRDHETGRGVWMLDPATTAKVQAQLSRKGRGLLEGGSCYSNIYTGGASEPHFCASEMGWGDMLKQANPLGIFVFAVWNIWSVVRTIALTILEVFIALGDAIHGVIRGHELVKELWFLPARVAVEIILRELIVIGASVDATRGLPVIEANFLGYDEQAHRRGPSSLFAHWSLKGIDDSIHRIWKAARRSHRRDYQVWLYSDHGQETTVPYDRVYGRSVQDAVASVFHEHGHEAKQAAEVQTRRGVESQRARWLGGGKTQKLLPKRHVPDQIPDNNELMVIAIGPLGQVHSPRELSGEERDRLARQLVEKANIPWVLTLDDDNAAWGYTPKGKFELPRQASEILGPDHPFLAEAAEDLVALCHHPDAGEFAIGGWRFDAPPISFAHEHGGHGGCGAEETRAFALLPSDAPVPGEKDYIRPLDLRAAGLHVLGRTPRPQAAKPVRRRARTDTVRIVTYNVHTCIGMDGKLSPSRIARVIGQCDPDIVALQELDVGRQRTGDIDQAHAIARELAMEFHFFPAVRVEEEKYGDAILSRYPMRLVKAGGLPGLKDRPELEPRGALWVEVEIDGQQLQLINTHLGLAPAERMAQIEALLGPEWLGSQACQGAAVLCGDFNALPSSKVYKRTAGRLRDAQVSLPNHRPQRTYFSRYPIGRIDHVFVSDCVDVVAIEVPRSEFVRTASDHLPLIAEIRLTKSRVGKVDQLVLDGAS